MPSYVWRKWVDSANSTTSSYTDTIWSGWVAETYTSTSITYSTTSSTTTGDIVWLKWVDDAYYDQSKYAYKEAIQYGKYEPVAVRKPVTFDRLKLRAENAQKAINRIWTNLLNDEKKREAEEAESVAKELLLQLIGDEQFERYKKTGRIFVKGKGRYDYVVSKDAGIYRIEKNKVIDFVKQKKAKGKHICIHLRERYKYPPTDNVIAMKMMIEAEERRFLKTGNLDNSESTIFEFDQVVGQ
jgi:hypothetical protein